MKKLVKSLLPEWALNKAIELRDRIRLAAVPAL